MSGIILLGSFVCRDAFLTRAKRQRAADSRRNDCVMANKTADRPHWLTITLALIAAGVSVFGIWWNYQEHSAPPISSAPYPLRPRSKQATFSKQIKGGTAVAGVQGNVTVNGSSSRKEHPGDQK